MRGPISHEPDIPWGISRPLHVNVPGLLQDDPLYRLLCAAFDDLLAPAVVALDCFDAYLDAALTPADFLPWLGGLVGAEPERAAIGRAHADYAEYGSVDALRAAAARAAGVGLDAVTVTDPGGVTWSSAPAEVTTEPRGPVRVVIRAAAVDAEPVRAAVEAARPVHCPVEVEVVAP